jgi:hypothetical protein
MPLYQLLTDRSLAQSSAITPTTLIHIVYTGDPSQNIAGSSYKAELGQLVGLFSGGTDTLVTGGTYSDGTITFTNSSGGTFPVTGLTDGSYYLPLSGGTVTGNTIFNQGLTANTISATTYLNISVPTLNQVLIEGNQTLGEDIILNDMDSIINTGNTIGIQFKTGATMYQYVTDNLDRETSIIMDTTMIDLVTLNTDDGYYATIQLDGGNNQMFEIVGDPSLNNFSRTTRQVAGISDYCGNGGITDYTSVVQNESSINTLIVSGSNEVTKWHIKDNQISGSTTDGVNTSLISLTPNNFRVETDNNQNIFFVDGTNNRVGISTNTPSETLDISGKTKTINLQMTSGATNGYVLTSDASGNASWQASSGGGGTFTGGTVSGATNFTNGLSANTISATTYLNLPLDIRVTGGTYSAGTTTFTNNTGGTFNVTGFTTGSTSTVSGDYLPLSGGTVSGSTTFTNGLTANTISATTYLNLPGLGATTATTTTIDFTGQTIYYNAASPATGNITNNLTNAKLGVIQKIYHNDVSEPAYPAGWVLLGDAIYFTSTLNIIYAEWAGGSRVEYWYVQEQ